MVLNTTLSVLGFLQFTIHIITRLYLLLDNPLCRYSWQLQDAEHTLLYNLVHTIKPPVTNPSTLSSVLLSYVRVTMYLITQFITLFIFTVKSYIRYALGGSSMHQLPVWISSKANPVPLYHNKSHTQNWGSKLL